MKRTSLLIHLLSAYFAAVSARGRWFNRFRPEVMANLGYGGAGVIPINQLASSYLQRFHGPAEELLQTLLEEDAIEESCNGKTCTANEHCCTGTVCIDTDGISGICMSSFGRKQGESCHKDIDCETGLICQEGFLGSKMCENPLIKRRQFNEDCTMSSECDITKGLCCQLRRAHRQAPRKVCQYFKDPLICIGPVNLNDIKEGPMEHTAGEKRISPHASNFK